MPTLEALDICPVLYHWPILISVRANSLSLNNFVNENYFFLQNNFDDLAAFLWYMHLYITNVLKETSIFGILINSVDAVLSECSIAFCIIALKLNTSST